MSTHLKASKIDKHWSNPSVGCPSIMFLTFTGYTLSFLQHHQKAFYAVGAPRYQHMGRVLIFEVDAKTQNWTLKQEIKGQQVKEKKKRIIES